MPDSVESLQPSGGAGPEKVAPTSWYVRARAALATLLHGSGDDEVDAAYRSPRISEKDAEGFETLESIDSSTELPVGAILRFTTVHRSVYIFEIISSTTLNAARGAFPRIVMRLVSTTSPPSPDSPRNVVGKDHSWVPPEGQLVGCRLAARTFDSGKPISLTTSPLTKVAIKRAIA